jgi:hypothetical protein
MWGVVAVVAVLEWNVVGVRGEIQSALRFVMMSYFYRAGYNSHQLRHIGVPPSCLNCCNPQPPVGITAASSVWPSKSLAGVCGL